jgi:hypothetical protein
MRGLDPRIHQLGKKCGIHAQRMDCRVVKFTLGPAKGRTRVPGNDDGWVQHEHKML